jgi:hypothetical protein
LYFAFDLLSTVILASLFVGTMAGSGDQAGRALAGVVGPASTTPLYGARKNGAVLIRTLVGGVG